MPKRNKIIEAPPLRKQKLPIGEPGWKRTRRYCKFCGSSTVTEVLTGEVRCQDCRSIYWLDNKERK